MTLVVLACWVLHLNSRSIRGEHFGKRKQTEMSFFFILFVVRPAAFWACTGLNLARARAFGNGRRAPPPSAYGHLGAEQRFAGRRPSPWLAAAVATVATTTTAATTTTTVPPPDRRRHHRYHHYYCNDHRAPIAPCTAFVVRSSRFFFSRPPDR